MLYDIHLTKSWIKKSVFLIRIKSQKSKSIKIMFEETPSHKHSSKF